MGESEFMMQRYSDRPSSTNTWTRKYHQHEEDQTDFRNPFMTDPSLQYSSSNTLENWSRNGSANRNAEQQQHPMGYYDHTGYTDHYAFNQGHQFGDVSHDMVDTRQGGLRDSYEDSYIPNENPSTEEPEEYSQQSWQKQYDDYVVGLGASGHAEDWKCPDMHLFKTSSYKDSVTSEKSSRIDPHTYQSYAAGLLYSSGRSEKFLKLQKHFAVLERIGELSKYSTGEQTLEPDNNSRNFGHSEPNFHSREELHELHSELEEARKNKEFFHEADKKGQFQWSPDKDFGLKKRESTLKEQVSIFRNMIKENESTKAPIKTDQIKRAVSFGALHEKFSNPELEESQKVSQRISGSDNRPTVVAERSSVQALASPALKTQPKEQTDSSESTAPRKESDNSNTVSYIHLMENAAKKSKQRAIHGTHMDPPRGEYEAYVEARKKITKEEADISDTRYSSSPISSKRSFPETFHGTQSSKDSQYEGRTMYDTSPKIEVGTLLTPQPELKTKLRNDMSNAGKGLTPQVPTHGQLFGGSDRKDISAEDTCGIATDTYKSLEPASCSVIAHSESYVPRQRYSDMPDIIQSEKHYEQYRMVPGNHSTPQMTVSPTSWSTSTSANPEYVNPDMEGTRELSNAEGQNEQFPSENQNNQQYSLGTSPPKSKEKGGVFRVKDFRKLAENNEFSVNRLSWMKKTPRNVNNKSADIGYGYRNQPCSETMLFRTPVGERSSANNEAISVSTTGDTVSHGDCEPLMQGAVPLYAHTAVGEFSSNNTFTEKKASSLPQKALSLSFRPMPSQSSPRFSATARGVESRSRQEKSTKLGETDTVEQRSRDTMHSAGLSRNWNTKQPETVHANRNTGIVFVNSSAQKESSPPRVYPSRKYETDVRADNKITETKAESKVTNRRPGDGNESWSDNPDKQYGQLRKWTAVADIYRDVEKSWSPTRESRPFPLENNSSISSTDTFIVKDTDEEDSGQEDMETSIASVSQLRQMFEGRQRMNKSKSEPDMSIDNNDEPRRPRSAKSQTGLSSIGDSEGDCNTGNLRTVSGDLAELRHRYDDEHVFEMGSSDFTEQTRPTDVALRAWMEYTGRPRYDPYMPPEDILKEVSAIATGRKLDEPRKKEHRLSNVSKMTLEYFDQIGSEWQRSSVRGSKPQRPHQLYSGESGNIVQTAVDSNPQSLDRRYLSHQYVNEQSPFSSNYPQTDDLKLKQSQWAASGFDQQTQRNQAYSGTSLLEQRPWPEETQLKKLESKAPQIQPELHSSVAPTTQLSSHPSNIYTSESGSTSEITMTRGPHSKPFAVTAEHKSPAQIPNSQANPSVMNESYNKFPHFSEMPNDHVQHISPGHDQSSEKNTAEKTLNLMGNTAESFPEFDTGSVPPEPARRPPASPQPSLRTPKPQPRILQHVHSKSSDSEHSSGDYGAVYCVTTGSVLYGADADEEELVTPSSQSHSSLVSSSATFPRKHAARQTFLQQQQPVGRSSAHPPNPIPRNHPTSSSATLAPSTSAATVPAPPTRGGSGVVRGAGTLPRAKGMSPSASSMSAVQQLGVKSPPPSAVGFGSAASAGAGASNPIPSAAAFKHQTSDARRPRPEPVNPEKERRRKEEEEAYRKKRLEELYEEERLKKMRRDEADAEARRHHDYFANAQKSPISPNRFDDAPSTLSPSTPGSLGTLERKDPQFSVPPERRRGFQIQGKARALFNFNAQNPRELSFRKNDLIYLLRQVDKNWFEGERHGRVGIFPTNYVEVVTSIEAAQVAAMQAEGQGRAKYTFTAQSSVELSLRKGEFVVLLRRVDENWYEGRIGNRQGIFPVNYVEITREPSTPLITPAPSVITTPMTGTPEMLSPVSYDAAPTPPPQPSPSAFTSQRSPSGTYNYQQPQQPGYGVGSTSLLAPATSVSRQQISLTRQDPDFNSMRSPVSNPKSPVSNSKSPVGSAGRFGSPGPGKRASPGPGPAPTTKLQVDIQSSAKPYANGQPAASRVTDDDLALTRYRALYAYRPQNEDELELQEGDEVFVMEKCDDGWYVGTSARTGGFGTFPGNYVQKICKMTGQLEFVLNESEMVCICKE